ncbi:hypothetical protein TcWFU_006382 [Taenia crassiceps]|uniref:Transmembrane protein n=1 Tax=Taenia crassiceps TaxID=6207 RepID=A0ABR4Q764_9CEST
MNTNVIHIFACLFTAALLLVPVVFHGFNCTGTVFSSSCGGIKYLQIMGGLILSAGVLIFLAALIICLTTFCHAKWLKHAAISVVSLSTILSAAAVILYFNSTKAWSPFMVSIAMTASFVHTVMLLIDVSSRLKSS